MFDLLLCVLVIYPLVPTPSEHLSISVKPFLLSTLGLHRAYLILQPLVTNNRYCRDPETYSGAWRTTTDSKSAYAMVIIIALHITYSHFYLALSFTAMFFLERQAQYTSVSSIFIVLGTCICNRILIGIVCVLVKYVVKKWKWAVLTGFIYRYFLERRSVM